MSKDGNSTGSLKLGVEAELYRNFGLVQDVGEFEVSEAGSGTYTAEDTSPLDQTTGSDLVIRNQVPIKSESDMVVTITGTDGDDNPLVGTATIKAQSPEDQAWDVVPGTAGKKFKTVTAVQVTNGLAGDSFEILVLPDSANDVRICLRQEIEAKLGTGIKQYRCGFETKGTKRIPVERTISITAWYTNNLEGLSRIRDREVTLVIKQKDDGRDTTTEYIFYDVVRLGVDPSIPADGEGEQTVRGEGFFKRRLVFS